MTHVGLSERLESRLAFTTIKNILCQLDVDNVDLNNHQSESGKVRRFCYDEGQRRETSPFPNSLRRIIFLYRRFQVDNLFFTLRIC